MLMQAVTLDAEMPASAVLERLALNGHWLDPTEAAAQKRIDAVAQRLHRPFDEVAELLARETRKWGAAIRRQWGTNVLWYARELLEVLVACSNAPPDKPLVDALGLHEHESDDPFEQGEGSVELRNGVMMARGEPVGVSIRPRELSVGFRPGIRPIDITLRGDEKQAAPTAGPIRAWPRIEAPDFKAASSVFEVIVGFGRSAQAGVSGAELTLPFSPERPVLNLLVELSTGSGVEALEGWSRLLSVTAADVEKAQVSFKLIGREPDNPERSYLTMLEVRYILDGTVCGSAARPLAIMPAAHGDKPDPRPLGQPWSETPASGTPVTLVADAQAPDLTLEISKPDRNPASGHYVCRLISPHPLATPAGPFDMNLGQDAKTFVASVVEEVRQYGNGPLMAMALESVGRLVAECLPKAFFQALAEVGSRARPSPPALLIVSAEPYVPWELAWLDAPLDPARPSYLGAQALTGRWLRDSGPQTPIAPDAAPRPATHPLSAIAVRNVAMMAAWYSASSGLRRLPKAEAEVDTLSASYPGIKLSATAREMRDLLNDALRGKTGPLAIDAVHLAGHGDYDPTRADASTLFLQDGPLRSILFRAAKYGGTRQPLLFLNACMLGIGGELLGDMAGFPGHSLRGGFGGVLGALWEVDDNLAHDIAIEFWRRALPAGSQPGESVGTILRDLRAKYIDQSGTPVPTFLAYVYYGHPRLTLHRAS